MINALSDYAHPCQVLADVMTIMDEFGPDLTGRTVAFIGDGNNVARSLAVICSKLGMKFILACPPKFELEPNLGEKLGLPALAVNATHDPHAAAATADVLYTDTWVSMGQEAEAQHRKAVFAPYQINARDRKSVV